MGKLRIVALISAHNEGDIIYRVIGDLVQQGIDVYLIDHRSTDDTAAQASRWLGKGLLKIEVFPDAAGYPEHNKDKYVWTDILRRKEELAGTLGADWYIHHDADEFRESPFPFMSLYTGICLVDKLGFNAIDFELLNFRPVDNGFMAGGDLKNYFRYFEWGEYCNSLQIKAWRNTGAKIDLTTHAGHSVLFSGRRIFPFKFILRHYPVRSQTHGIRKIFNERKPRYSELERTMNWHVQYDRFSEGCLFIAEPSTLIRYNPWLIRGRVLCRRIVNGFRLGYKDVIRIIFGNKS